ncbi:MAG: hypothetical protein KAJ49_07210 [Arcobacteraceae bacterium]|nr:hypothetical protein [Arcobacteraceae bacterium]
MGTVIDTIVVILFIGLLVMVLAGFNRQMVEQNNERKRKSEERMKKSEEMKEDKKDD